MRKLLNTLFVSTEDAYLSLENNNVIIRRNGQKLGQIPLHVLEEIITFTYSGASPMLLGKCADMGIGFTMLSPGGKFLCRINGTSHGNVLLRREQYRIADDEQRALSYVRNMISGKIFNARWTIRRTLRDYPMRVNSAKLEESCKILRDKITDVKNSASLDTIRGIEGDAAAEYFSVFDDMILNQKESFGFNGRNRRPPMDNVNAMLSFFYTLLSGECANALEAVGLDSYVGLMHTDKPGRKSLSLDLMEELRAPIVDRFVLTLINQRQIKARDFIKSENGAVRFTDEAKKRILTAWQEKKKEQLTHPYLQEKINWGLVPYIQALLLSRCIRGDLCEYPPFFWK